MNDREIIKEFYNNGTEYEWNRIGGRPEFLLTCRFLDKYIKPGMKVLDIGGGPGRYSIYLAGRGCDMTLVDLSDGNVELGKKNAADAGVTIRAMQGDACEIDKILDESFDAVLLMGPLYHLLEESERIQAVEAALKLLKPAGYLFAAFITMFSSMIDYMKGNPEWILNDHPAEVEFKKRFFTGESYAGDAFTRAYFTQISDIEPFMGKFPLEKITMFGQEGILSPCEDKIFACSPEVIEKWLDIAEFCAAKPEYLSWAEHILYIGRKKD